MIAERAEVVEDEAALAGIGVEREISGELEEEGGARGAVGRAGSSVCWFHPSGRCTR
ncbi:MAG: hypothetical protein JRD92_19245 [Deltaproteobacteria bacterium]|nr:hypothetical protein [Deltaproteobacteria bacterium]